MADYGGLCPNMAEFGGIWRNKIKIYHVYGFCDYVLHPNFTSYIVERKYMDSKFLEFWQLFHLPNLDYS